MTSSACESCGATLRAGISACSRCGEAVSSSPVVVTPPEAQAAELTTARSALISALTREPKVAEPPERPAPAHDYTEEWAEYRRQKADVEQQWRDYNARQAHLAASRGGYHPHATGTNSMAIAGFVLVWFCGIPGLVFGHVALSQIRRTGEGGRGLAIATLVIGYLGIVLAIIYYAVLASLLSST